MRYLLTLIFVLLSYSLEAKNLLQYETSPYLLQHADNPVKWMPWGDEAFQKAKREHKKIFLSIGYSTCHWCHVMEEEAFTNKKIATLFNKYFVAIKVDKEEMPHLDNHFQELHKKLKGRAGGWPLSVFMDVKQNIYYISTYIPPQREPYSEGLDTLLEKIAKQKEPLKKKPIKEKKSFNVNVENLKTGLLKQYDDIYGGFGRGKKFPEVSKLSLMFDIAQIEDDEKLYKYTYEMLDIMALRGLYDHVEGGFYRYSVDAAWEIPHFEKMLYNQAELVYIYTDAYELSKKQLYKNVVQETIQMLEQRLTQDNLFLSASDSDSDGKEGYYFTFSPQEIQNALRGNPYKEEIEDASGFTLEGNFEDRVHLNFYEDDRPKGFYDFQKNLQEIRKRKKFPFIDKKINTAWNALMIEALYKASSIDEKYAYLGEKHLNALKSMMFDKGDLYHQGIIGIKPKQKALLEDYAFMIGALLEAYEYNYDEEKLHFAEYLLSKSLYKFYKKGTWYASDDGLHIVAKTKDKYYVSAVSKMIHNLFKIASLKSSFKYEKIAIKSLKKLSTHMSVDTPALARAYLMKEYGYVIIKANKSHLKKKKIAINSVKYPYVLTKKLEIDDYLFCTMRRCFYKGNDMKNIDKTIKLNIRK